MPHDTIHLYFGNATSNKLTTHEEVQLGNFILNQKCKYPAITNLQFANDMITSCKANVSSALAIQRVLNQFALNTILCINIKKSYVLFTLCDTSIQHDILGILGIYKGSLPFRHFGVPVTSKTNHILDII